MVEETKQEEGLINRIGQRIKYFINPSIVEQEIAKGVEEEIEQINKELAVFSKALVQGGSGGGQNFVLYDVVGSRGGFGQRGVAYTETRPMMDFLYHYGVNHSTLMAIITALMGETFRNGLSAQSLFESKCVCGATFDNLVEECPACGSKEIIEPEIKMREKIEQELIDPFAEEKINENDQTVLDVVKEQVLDLLLLDVQYGLLGYDYKTLGGKTKLINAQEYSSKLGQDDEIDPLPDRTFKAFYRAHPALVRPLVDDQGIIGGGYTCVIHRKQFHDKKGICPEVGCGSVLFPVTHVRFKSSNEEVEAYYIKGEIIQTSYIFPSPIGGVPPVRILFKPLDLINRQVDHLLTFYTLSRHPSGLVWVKHRNADDLEAFWLKQGEERKKNPHHVPLIQISPDVTGEAIGYLSLDSTPSEMNLVETREEATRIIASFYGVSPIFLNDASTGGGLNNEGLQITVTNRAVATLQELINSKILAPLIKAMDITDYTLILNPSEEKDEQADLELEKMKNEIALQWNSLGWDVERDEDGNWVLGEKREVEELTDPFAQAMREDEDNGKDSAPEKPVKPHSSSPAKPDHEVSL